MASKANEPSCARPGALCARRACRSVRLAPPHEAEAGEAEAQKRERGGLGSCGGIADDVIGDQKRTPGDESWLTRGRGVHSLISALGANLYDGVSAWAVVKQRWKSDVRPVRP